ncbi:hypothetical protein OGAPHI_006483 [Ogataea philodendri]|uniref:Uncharacterized protein n=1 Tax=Ogataea philodendri TaxID=1378263 RepID=A0A9P8NXC3_9ASCO|nr:uncharacterized protein OGAPHI_006483 [Ogataea philodendri]KAH3661633.1 hypothetical protein OGAPHI_006483 [Ogataea philodendri]
MKFISLLATATAVSGQFILAIKSSDSLIAGATFGIYSNGQPPPYDLTLRIGDSREMYFDYDSSDQSLEYLSSDKDPQEVTIANDSSVQVSFDKGSDKFAFNTLGQLTINGNRDGLYACQGDVSQPGNLRYLKYYPRLNAPDTCSAFYLQKAAETSSSAVVSKTVFHSSTQAITTCPTCSATSSASGGSNGTASSVSSYADAATHVSAANIGILGGLVLLIGAI